jgi:hypothetical protein
MSVLQEYAQPNELSPAEKAKQEASAQLLHLIDTHGLAAVLSMIEVICEEKATITSTWFRSPVLSHVWGVAAARISPVARMAGGNRI